MDWLRRRLWGFPRDVATPSAAEGLQAVPETAPAVVDSSAWRQGDVFACESFYVLDGHWAPITMPVDDRAEFMGVAIVSQSCDASLPHRPWVQVAPVFRLTDDDTRHRAEAGTQTQYAPLPGLGEGCFLDLTGLSTVAKTALAASSRSPGVLTDEQIRTLATAISRRFGRFAFPDEVNEALRPLSNKVRDKAHKPNSPLGKAMKYVKSLRVECPDWEQRPLSMTILFVLETDATPDDEGAAMPGSLEVALSRCRDADARVKACLDAINEPDAGPVLRYWGWLTLANQFADQCQQAGSDAHPSMFGVIEAEVLPVDEVSMVRYLATEALDLDYLSDSRQ